MFKLVATTTLSFVVNVDYPQSAGKTKAVSLDLTTERPDTDALNELIGASRMSDLKRVRSTMKDHIVGWTNFRDEAGDAIEFNEENLQQFLDDPALLMGAAAAFGSAVNGGARAKNSKGRPAGTPK